MIPEWHDPALHTPQRPIPTNTSASAPTTAAPGKRKRASADAPGGSEPRRKSSSRVKTAEQTSLEAQIERENPHASKTQLKSLKLRALHAGRIAERERDMSEKEKARRLKLREYMRRRREEERGDVIVKPEVKPEMGVEGRLGLMAGSSTSTELNADDRSAAFSIMGLNQSFLHGPSAPVPALPHVPQTQTDHNLHLHPLFQMPVPLGPLPSTHFDPAINNTTTSATTTSNFADVWSSLPSDSNERANGDPTAEEFAERALHAALEEAIELQEQEARLQEQADHQHQQQSNSEALEQERIRIAEEEILGVERERIADAELAIIAHHHQQTSSEALEQERIRIAEEEILGVERARVAAAVANVGNGGD
ncbi:hypothetical protein CROQUDRAFT_654657 [Cronartium quercuum f. sp. fusiforme G11]|uniref:Uncharacterized protein n=1 Tax=Cronartium quercuum f. sp. fusiforme G11 TaxID=708437 RepID=A0A9P6NQQ4_9BASI|nr:hypothetical protein CROQUDRAFT_654657 [Cronartium quercuum f. sp. fusiforme G11]